MKPKIFLVICICFFILQVIFGSTIVFSNEFEEKAQEQYYLGIQHLRHKEYDTALAQFRKVISEYPGTEVITDVYLGIGEIKKIQDKNDEAIIAFKKALDSKPGDLKTTEKLIDLFFETYNYEEINYYLEKLLIAKKDNLHKSKRTRIYLLDKVWDKFFRKSLLREGLKTLDLITDYFPDSVESAKAWLRKGNWYKSQSVNDFKNSIACYKKVLETFSDLKAECAQASYEIAYIYFDSKQYKEAIPYFSLVIDKYIHKNYDLNALYYLGKTCRILGEKKLLEKMKEKLISYRPVSPRTYIEISDISRELGWIDLSREFFKKAIEEYSGHLGLSDKRILWFSDLVYNDATSLALGDLDGDGEIEVVIGNKEGISVLRGKTGELIWQFKTKRKVIGTIVLGDLDGDKLDDIVFSTEKDIRTLKGSDGTTIWKVSKDTFFTGTLLLGKFGGKTLDVAVIGRNNKLYCLNGKDGREKWQYYYCYSNSSLVAKDVDLDGIDDLVFSGFAKELVLLNGRDAVPIWKFSEVTSSSNHIVICPINQDETPDVFTITHDRKAMIIDGKTGKRLWKWGQFDYTSADMTVLDIDADGSYDVVLPMSKSTAIISDISEKRNISFFLSYPCQSSFLVFKDYMEKKKNWLVFNDPIAKISILSLHSALRVTSSGTGSNLKPELKFKLVDRFEDELFQYGWRGRKGYCRPVIGDIDGDQKLELIVNMGRTLYALETGISCQKDNLIWPMSGLNYRHNNFFE